MNWEAIGAVGEILGAAGVIISLLYLAVQTRGDARAKRAAAIHEQSLGSADVLLAVATKPEVAELFFRGIHDFGSLTGAELPRFGSLVGHMFRIWEDQFFQWNDGHLDPPVWNGLEAPLDDIIPFPGVQAWWATRLHWYTEQFRSFVEEKLSKQRAPSMYGESTT